MATKELRELRHRYKEACTTYMSCVQALSDASERGEWLAAESAEKEVAAFTQLALVRHELIETLVAHSRKKA